MDNSLRRALQQNVSQLRSNLNLTQHELAKKTGVSTSYIGSLERGRKIPSLKMLEKLAAALNVSPVRLLFYRGEGSNVRDELDFLIRGFDENEVKFLCSIVEAYDKYIKGNKCS